MLVLEQRKAKMAEREVAAAAASSAPAGGESAKPLGGEVVKSKAQLRAERRAKQVGYEGVGLACNMVFVFSCSSLLIISVQFGEIG